MKRFFFATIIFIFLLFSFKTYALNWQSLNVTLVEQKEDGLRTVLTLKDAKNRIFSISYDDAISTKMADKIIKYKNEFYSWQTVHFKDLSFVISDSFLEMMIIPQEIIRNDQNLVAAIPAGITMTYYPEKDTLHYDFRIMKENQFIRIGGDYQSEDELLSKFYLAYDNPSAFLLRSDPEYLVKEIEQLQHDLGVLMNENKKLQDSFESFSDLANQYQKLQDCLADLANENEQIRQVLLYLHNEDFFNRFRLIPVDTIRQVVELKRNNPKLPKSDLWELVRQEKIKISTQEFDLILIVYFNEFVQKP
jgi:hypothetical protein